MKVLINRMHRTGYKMMGMTAAGIDVMYIVQNGLPCVYCFVDWDKTKSYSPFVEKNIKDFFIGNGYENIALLNIIYTCDAKAASEGLSECSRYWIYDMKEHKLIVPENQPSDFFGFRKVLVNYIYESVNGVSHSNNLSEPGKEKQPSNVVKFHRKHNIMATYILIGVNVLVFLITALSGDVYDASYMFERGASSAASIVIYSEYYRLFTSMFLHFGFEHIFNNMFSLYIMGTILEERIGKLKFFIVYIAGGLIASVASTMYNWNTQPYAVCAGASGAVYAVLGAYIVYMLLNDRGSINFIGIVIVVFMPFLSSLQDVQIDNAAHIGGLVAGMIIAYIMDIFFKNKRKRG